MTWWRRLLGLPEPEDIYYNPYSVTLRLTPEEYYEYCSKGWAKATKGAKMEITSDTITITRRPMSHAVREAEGAQPLSEEQCND